MGSKHMLAVEKATLVISVYKNVDALRVILGALETQSVTGFEVIVSEDGECPGMLSFLQEYNAKNYRLRHLRQKDVGWRKNQALNNAVRNSEGDYLIFIDGDCVPHPKFIEAHLKLAEPKVVFSGNRVLLGPKTSAKLSENKVALENFSKHFLWYVPALIKDKATRLEEGLYINPNGPFGRMAGKATRDILGCNFSCFKQDLLDINGFDEDYLWPRAGEDNDVRWRMLANGVKLKSARNIAIQYHLYHDRPHYGEGNPSKDMMEEKMRAGIVFCQNGLKKHVDEGRVADDAN